MPAINAVRSIETVYRARTPCSATMHDEARRYFPGAVTRSVAFFPPYPVYVARGTGCHVHDVDGNEYIDHLGNFGSIIHGHAHPSVVAAVRDQLPLGTDFGAPTKLHLALAHELTCRIGALERLRFATSGSEAVLYAVRAARAFTGRAKILKFEGSYHGGYDSVSVSVDPGANAAEAPAAHVASAGLPPDVASHTLVARFNDLESVERLMSEHRDSVAAVIVEPVTVRGMIPAEKAFLHGLREITRRFDALLIMDEVVTFRLSHGGAQQHFAITPDLTTLGKIIGGGLPVGAFGGRADVMEGFAPGNPGGVHHSGTFAGNAAVMVAGLATLELLTPAAITRLNALGDRLRDGLRTLSGVQVTGFGSLVGLHLTDHPVRNYRDTLASDRDVLRSLHLALLNRGVFARAGGSFFLSTAMSEGEIDETVAAVAGALGELM
jgi:glutamate-1-semialdehyde 2,1-aminomutase